MPSFYYRNGHFYCEDVSLVDIASAVGTPTYIYSKGEITNRAAKLNSVIKSFSSNSHVCYALKANGNPTLLRILVNLGLGADVTSGGELFLALHAGFEPATIVFSGVGKSIPEIQYALSSGIHSIHVESKMELEMVASIAESMAIIAPISIRINPNVPTKTHPHIQTGQYAHKFGVAMDMAVEMYHFASNHNWLKPIGLAAHIGSQIRDLEPFRETATLLVNQATKLANAGIELEYLDLGGGLGIDYDGAGAPEPSSWLESIIQPVFNTNYNLLIEPGRSIIGPAGCLLTKILYRKKQSQKKFLIVDAGMNDLIRPALYDAYHPIVPVKESDNHSHVNEDIVDIVGPVCETGDTLGSNRLIPQAKQGDLLAILHTGAYGFSMSSNYNGRCKPAEVLIDGNQFSIIRKRQSVETLLDGCL